MASRVQFDTQPLYGMCWYILIVYSNAIYGGYPCNSAPNVLWERHWTRLSIREAFHKKYMLLRFRCTLSCWNNLPGIAYTCGRTTAKKTWLMHRFSFKLLEMGTGAVWYKNIMPLQILMPGVGAVWRWMIRAARWRHPGSRHNRSWPIFVHKQKRDSAVKNICCHSCLPVTHTCHRSHRWHRWHAF